MNRCIDVKTGFGIILLAAGSSRRMGSINKLLARLPQGPQESILKLSAKQASSSIVHSKLPGYLTVVSGHAHNDVQTELDSLSVKCVYNPDADSGMASSLQVGLLNLQEQTDLANTQLDFIIVCLGDMPHIQSETIAKLINARQSDKTRDFIVPVFEGQRGHPVLIGHAFFAAMNELTGDVGARKLIKKNPKSTFEIIVSDAGVLKDYDLPADLT
jgi:molybdenum cofactor cytidylyltransferase